MSGVFGIETEYGIAASPIAAEEAARELFRPVVAWGRSTNVFTPSGSRLYLDVGSHPEYATAECSTLTELLAVERAGDRLMAALAAAASRRTGATITLIRNNTDSAGHAFGCHENYQIDRAGSADVAAKLIPFLVTRQIVAGAGKVQVDPSGARYLLSPRARHTSEALSSATTRSRPMINTRDEPHADGTRYRRLHVIVGDSNMSGAASRFKVGATALLLRAAQHGIELPDLELANPVHAIREVAQGWRQGHPIALADGRSIRPAEVQWLYFEAAQAAAALVGSGGSAGQPLGPAGDGRAGYPLGQSADQAGDQWVSQHLNQAVGRASDRSVRQCGDQASGRSNGQPGSQSAVQAAAQRAEDQVVLDLWRRALTAWDRLDFDRADGLATELDWLAKLRLIERYRERTGAALADPRVLRLELAYHQLGGQDGLREKLEESGNLVSGIGQDEIAGAVAKPPSTTRAHQRGRFIAAARAAGQEYTVDWVRLKVGQGEAVNLIDPLDAANPAAERLIGELESHPQAGTTSELDEILDAASGANQASQANQAGRE
ncbi:MAG: proteasome accessory factor PafA2 family protein [Bifidobacteriaceae bacterium]|nr:proteasome accessory factor PafA2 family protein [Bifidobacteriaceae bacterium]